MMLRLAGVLPRIRKALGKFIGSGKLDNSNSKYVRLGLGLSGGLLVGAGIWTAIVEMTAMWGLALGAGLIIFGIFNIFASRKSELTLTRANQLALAGHFTAILSFYLIFSRFLMVSYTTDTIVATYVGVLKALQLQSPYPFSIKPFLDQFGFSPSFYTPGINGSFDFHIAYPSLSFLSVLPLYVLGIHDLRDTIFIFHIATVLLIFGLAPAKFKSVSLAPFGLFPFVIAGSWTDSIWAFMLVLTAVFWYRNPKASWVSLGLAVATKQIAIVVAPFLLIRDLHEHPQSKLKVVVTSVSLIGAAFILPNLPFILASPGAWWKDIIGPYLPSAPAQVPGGLGLSEILLDLGIALPSSFFLVLMLGASSILLYAYARHYKGLNSLVFAFPIIMFFFYYRSFPNYMAYWVFPVVFEFCRLGGPSLHALTSFKLPTISWRPTSETVIHVLRRRLTPSLLLIMAVTLAFVGVSGAYIAQSSNPKAMIQINSVKDTDNIGAATSINVTLKNLLTTTVSPAFFVKWTLLTYLWNSNSTETLSPGSENSFVLTAPDARSAVPSGSPFHVLIYDRNTGQLLGESSGGRADTAVPALANPGLKWWVLDSSVGRRVPFGWKLSPLNTDLSSSRIAPLGYNGTSGLQMFLNYTSTSTGIEELAFSQKTLLNATRLSLHFNQSFETAPGTFFGASLSDGLHTLYYVFSDHVTQPSISTFAENTTITLPIQPSQWNTVSIDPVSVWTSLGWTAPPQVTLSIIVRSDSIGTYYASLDQISAA